MSSKQSGKPLIYRYRIVFSAVLALALGAACYLWENVPLAYGESFDKLYFVERFIQKTFGHNETVDDGLFINVGYDKAVADVDLYDMDGLFTGKVEITDRAVLDNLLARLEDDDTYRYIFLDVRFEKGIETPNDSALFNRIARMRDIVIATHHDIKLASPLLESKASISDYKTVITNTGFTRYQFIQNAKASVPLRIYQDLTGKDIRKIGPVYMSDGLFCHNALFVRIPEDFSENLVGVLGAEGVIRQRYYDCGPQIDEFFPLKEKADGRIVIIGDFVNDVAGTYMGEQPNSYLAFLATEGLMHGRHRLSPVYMAILLALFWGVFMAILSKNGISPTLKLIDWLITRIRKKGVKANKFNSFIWNMFGYGISLFLIGVVLFLAFGVTFSIFIPSTVFSVMETVTDTWPE